jgi:hypothetical protein
VNRESNISPSQEESSSSVSSAGLPSDERETAPSRTQADSQAVAAKIPQTVLKANPLSASNNADGVLQVNTVLCFIYCISDSSSILSYCGFL